MKLKTLQLDGTLVVEDVVLSSKAKYLQPHSNWAKYTGKSTKNLIEDCFSVLIISQLSGSHDA